YQLRPTALEHTGLAAALQARLDAVESRGGIRATLQVEGTEQLAPAVQAELYHVAQEALNNALKHARARSVHIALCFRGPLTRMEISDDGAGFDLAAVQERGGMGLPGMRERVERIGAQLIIDTAPGQGTRIAITVSEEAT